RTGQPIYELEGRTVGLIGLGYIGSELARKLRLAFNCRVLAYDPHVNRRLVHASGAELVETLPELLRQSQVLCCAAELTQETRGMIGPAELKLLPKDAVVVNAARGALIDVDALVAALDSGHLLGAGIDTTFPEPLPANHPLLKHPRVVLSPHTAGVTMEATERLARSAADQIFATLAGELPTFALNPEAWEGKASRRPAKKTSRRSST
ncbi:MAG: NAD(P)-dependent oxidoreductase, partial [Pseudomonadota bacterium]|nr:NAD(P)-dependent oxidoreductase [Pseudomonadota bacterium]